MDPISDMLISIKHASLSSKESATVPYSKFRLSIGNALVKAGYLKAVSKKTRKSKNVLELSLAYSADGTPLVHNIKRISKPSRRLYSGAKSLKPVRSGYGLTILSTPKGVLTDQEARKENVGGEILFSIW